MLFFFNSNVIYDIDDMLFITKQSEQKQNIFQKIKGRRKPVVLMKYAEYVIVCTPKLEEIALEINKNKRVIDISSTFDTERFVPVSSYNQKDEVVIGWTGTHSTIPYLETLQPILSAIQAKRKIKLLVIANKEYKMPSVSTDFIFWSADTEMKDLHKIDIGLYPIPANEWSLGKSSLKALTYMAIAIPFVTTAYGTNYRIMKNGVEGFMAKDEKEWEEYLLKLIDDVSLRQQMGLNGRKTVEESFSVRSNLPKYSKVFKTVTNN